MYASSPMVWISLLPAAFQPSSAGSLISCLMRLPSLYVSL